MKRASVTSLILCFFLGVTTLVGQQNDPSEIFLKAYLSAQQGEKLEHENQFKTALAKYRFAGSLIAELRKSHADWQPAIVEYRGRKISEGILRIQERMTRQNALSARSSPLPEVVPSLPETESWSEPGPEVVASQPAESSIQESRDASVTEATKKVRNNVDQLQAALEKSRNDLQTARKEKENVDARLKETNSKLGQAQSELDQARESERQTRDQLVHAQESLRESHASQQKSVSDQQELRAEIARLKESVAAADQSRVAAEKQKNDIQAKFAAANNQIITLEHQRDEALAQLNVAKEAEHGVQLLLAEKEDLKQKLANAEEQVRTLSESDPIKAQKFAEINQQLGALQQRLAESEKTNDYLAARAAELGVQLDEAGTELQAAKLAGANSEESEKLARENELLRNIVVRERQEEARRDEARKVVITELDRLKIRSDALNRQIELLAQPCSGSLWSQFQTSRPAYLKRALSLKKNRRPALRKLTQMRCHVARAIRQRKGPIRLKPVYHRTSRASFAARRRTFSRATTRQLKSNISKSWSKIPTTLTRFPILVSFTFAPAICARRSQP